MAANPKHWPGAWNTLPGRQPPIRDQYSAQIGANIDGMNIGAKKAYLMDVLNGVEQSDEIIPDFAAAANILRRRGGRRNRKSHRKNRKSHRRNRKSQRR